MQASSLSLASLRGSVLAPEAQAIDPDPASRALTIIVSMGGTILKKSAFLKACSLVAYFAATGTAAAQQGQTTPKTSNPAESLVGTVPVPQNSDAAEEEKARRNAERE